MALPLTGVLPPFFQTLDSRIGFSWSSVEDTVQIFIGFIPATPIQPETMLSVEDATLLTFPFVENISLGA
ncbi:MAG: hypothetical protein EZS28_025196 [Streblomastix strix]|uniref:Uncharacterized protein n=1 Tax=Streblomastix strix TaxID=222440 RepID=A0A5J4VA07_9EUKA|nr:MAG: hypothetical protein EZS28_025196 [Streblomastix strix]